jgi:CubicO group peptidase (beta-lactamase class C family)
MLMNRFRYVVWLFLLVMAGGSDAQRVPGRGAELALDRFIQEQMSEAYVPGLAAAITRGGELVWAKGYGWANPVRRSRVSIDTPFMLASVSKLVTGTAVMQLVEQGALELDVDINRYLPFPVRNPHADTPPITVRSLLAHVSGLRDSEVLGRLYVQGDSPVSLERLLRGYLVPGGEYYDPSHYAVNGAEQEWRYANIGYALLGYLVERAGGREFPVQCQERIFAPLQMNRSHWFLDEHDRATLAMPSFPVIRSGGAVAYLPFGHYGYPDYPDGQLRASVSELARFMAALAQGGQWGGSRILEEETVQRMRAPSYPMLNPGMGLAFFRVTEAGRDWVMHTGGDRGVNTMFYLDPAEGLGVIILANSGARYPGSYRHLKAIFLRLVAYADAR